MPVDKFGRSDNEKVNLRKKRKTLEVDDGYDVANLDEHYVRRYEPREESLNMNDKKLYNLPEPIDLADAATKKYVDRGNADFERIMLDNYMDKTMTDDLDLKSKRLVNVANPIDPMDAATKKYADDSHARFSEHLRNRYVQKTMHSEVNANSNKITNVATPTNAKDVATKHYVDLEQRKSDRREMKSDLNAGFNKILNLSKVDDTDVDSTAVNKGYVDSAVIRSQEHLESQVGDLYLNKQSGGTMEGGINMNGENVFGLNHDPEFDSSAVSRKYVDDNSVWRKGDIMEGKLDMGGHALTNLPDSVNMTDAFTLVSVVERVKYARPVITVYAEEAGTLEEGKNEWSFGNGGSGLKHGQVGYPMPSGGEIIRMALASSDLNNRAVVNLVVNGVESDKKYSIEKTENQHANVSTFGTPLKVNDGDRINFVTKTNNPKAASSVVSLLIELDPLNKQ